MKTIIKALAFVLAICTVCCIPVTASAETPQAALIEPEKTVSLSLYKYDMTSAEEDGAWNPDSVVSSGKYDQSVIDAMQNYAVQGVEFAAVKVGSFDVKELKSHEFTTVYGISDKEFLKAVGFSAQDAALQDGGVDYYTTDSINAALAEALKTDATAFKNSMEQHIKSAGTMMPLTDEFGHTTLKGMEQGLYLVVETRVPENVTSTCNPFLVSLPMTNVDGSGWNYDVTVYPKNMTGMPTLDKTVRESKLDTGKNKGLNNDIKDGYAGYATASDGDAVDYQIISTLPTITSEASHLTQYTFSDQLSKGISYKKSDVKIEFFSDKGCKNAITSWDEASGSFTVEYADLSTGSQMTVKMTEAGLKEINTSDKIYKAGSEKRGFSDCTMRITYSAKVNSNADVIYGDKGNPNTVTLTWSRTNTELSDTLTDDAHVFTYGMEITKKFSDGKGKFDSVSFNIKNKDDGYYILADKAAPGLYFVKGHVSEVSQATVFTPNTDGKIIVKGLEDDTYIVDELTTDKEYNLLKSGIKVNITTESGETCPMCHTVMPTARAKVNNAAAEMIEDNASANAVLPMTIVNTKGFELPKTGSYGTWMFTVGGVLLLGGAVFLTWKLSKENKKDKK